MIPTAVIFMNHLDKIIPIIYVKNRRKALVTGDSHACIFNHNFLLSRFPGWDFQVANVGGASLAGIQNPNSKTQAWPSFKEAVEATKAKVVISLLGEVDCGFLIPLKVQQGGSLRELVGRALVNYGAYLDWTVNIGRQPIVISAPLPTIADDVDWKGEVADARREVTVSQVNRTKITRQFNLDLGELCNVRGIPFINLDPICFDVYTGVVREDLVRRGSRDHHYRAKEYIRLLESPLRLALSIAAKQIDDKPLTGSESSV